jgi:hypothetical protein
LAVERLDAISARGLGLTPTGALLARPDGYATALWNDGETARERLGDQPRSAEVAPRARSQPARRSRRVSGLTT